MIFAVNKLDDDQADFDATVSEARQHFGHKIVVIQYPLQVGAGFHEIIDVLRMVRYKFTDLGGKPEKHPIPETERERADFLHKELVEAVAGNDETLMEKYFEKGELDEEELVAGMKKALIANELYPLFCVSAARNMGSGRLMGFIDMVCPGAHEMPPQYTLEEQPVYCTPDGPTVLFVYKSVSEPHIGELSFFKVYSGKLRSGAELVNAATGGTEKINQLFVVEGNKRLPVQELVAGDIGAAVKLRNAHVNDTLHEKNHPLIIKPIEFPVPYYRMAIETVHREEEEKLAEALHHIRTEDPTVTIEFSPELKQTILHCQGDMHLSVIKWKIEHYHRVEVRFRKPAIPYRETIRRAAEATYRHKKQSGGSGQFGEVSLRIEPWTADMPDPAGLTVRGREEFDLDWGGRLLYYNCIVGGAIDTRFMPSILKGIREKMQEGPVTGSYVRDIRVSVFDGRMHPVDSNDISFKIAGMKAFKDAFRMADPQILEPVYQLEVTCPDELTGAIIGDLQTRRAVLEGMESQGHFTVVKAKVPLAELQDYSSSLRSMTQGRAKFNMQFFEYLPVSNDVQKKLSADYASVEKEEV